MEAGFDANLLNVTTSTVTYASPDRIRFISESWAKRVSETQLGSQMISYGLATQADVQGMAKAWREWGRKSNAMMFYVDVSIVGRK